MVHIDNKDFEIMIAQNKLQILKICRFYSYGDMEAANDLFQDIVLNLWESYPRYVKRPNCKQSTWLYRVALNTALMQKRKNSRLSFEALHKENIQSEQYNDDNEIIRRLYELIDQLNEGDKTLIYLFLDEKSHQDIADIMGLSVSNVGTRIQRIKLKLKQLNIKSEI